MMPTATHGLRDAWSASRPSGEAAQRRGSVRPQAFDGSLAQAQDASGATLDSSALASSGQETGDSGMQQASVPDTQDMTGGTGFAEPSEGYGTDATSSSGVEDPQAWTGAQAAAYSQEYGTPYPAAAEALTTPPPVAGPAAGGDGSVAAIPTGDPSMAFSSPGSGAMSTDTTGMTMGGSSPDAAAAYGEAASTPSISPDLATQQGFSEMA